MKKFRKSAVIIVLLSVISFFPACTVYNTGTTETVYYENPQWAPDYYSGVRYYYLPDIEVYYDLSLSEFIYLNNGRWMYSRILPSVYSYYDLYSGYVVVLNLNVYRPWMHHQFYVSNYPRYYYRDYYDRSNFPYVRGYNENLRSAIYWKEHERNRARDWNDENLRKNRNFRYSSEDRRQQDVFNQQTRRTNSSGVETDTDRTGRTTPGTIENSGRRQQESGTVVNRQTGGTAPRTESSTTTRPETSPVTNRTGTTPRTESTTTNRTGTAPRTETTPRTESTTTPGTTRTETTTRQQPNAPASGAERQANQTNYYGRSIGQSVKVEKQMREPATNNPNTESNSQSSGGSRNAQSSQRR